MDFDAAKKTLVIVESPTKANTIRKYLPSNFTVTASKGHVRDLPEDRMGVDINNDFAPEYVITEGKEKLIKELKKDLSASEQLLLATDEDREGESISWHLKELLKPRVPYQRMVFHEITSSAIKEALKSGRSIDMQLVHAQEDRRIIDRLYGYEVSPVLWKRLSNNRLSGGRVQSVGLRFIVDREIDRLNFHQSSFYDLKAELKTKDSEDLEATLEEVNGVKIASSRDFDSDSGAFIGKTYLLDKEAADKLKAECESLPFIVESVIQKPGRVNPYPPFTTSTLQQAANRRLRMSARETMRVAQSLFENGFITYMRTDSVNLSDQCINASRRQIEEDYGHAFLEPKVRHFTTKSVNAQEAHEAIRPSGDTFRRPKDTNLTGRELELYTLIYRRTLATQMKCAEKSTTTIRIACGDNIFSSSGTVIVFPGFLKVYEEDDKKDDKIIPMVTAGDNLSLVSLESVVHLTQPPARYNEASLVKRLEEKGIGRPSTYATIISTLLDRNYALEKDRALVPTFMGFDVFNFMEKAFPELIKYSYTSDMEKQLDLISTGEEDSLEYLNYFYYGDGKKEKGLKEMVAEAKTGKEDVKTLTFPHLKGVYTLSDNRVVNATIKAGPYGAYLLTDLKDESGKDLIINFPPSLSCPGLVTENDIITLISSTIGLKSADGVEKTLLKSGRRGEFWQRGDKVCYVPRGKKKATDYSEKEIDFFFSLPIVIAKDDEGNEITINKGPYGGYLSCNGNNYRVYGPLEEVTAEKAKEIVAKVSKHVDNSISLKEFEGKPLELKKGRYGYFLKWGSENVRLPKDVSKDIEALTQEKAEAICKESSSNSDDKSLGSYNGNPILLMNGRFGHYLKCGDKNYRIPKSLDVSSLDENEALKLIEESEKKSEAVKDFGLYKGEKLVVLTGRYGLYLKHGKKNIALPSKVKKDISLLTEEDAHLLADEKA